MAKASESLWWDPFVDLFEELDRAPLSDDLPDNLVSLSLTRTFLRATHEPTDTHSHYASFGLLC